MRVSVVDVGIPEFIASEYSPGDEERLVELLETVFDGWPHFDLPCSNVDHWRWKFLDNPLRRSFITCVEYNGQMVGVQKTVDQRVKIGDQMLTVSNNVDTGTHPKFRRMGVMRLSGQLRGKIIEERGQSSDFGMALSGNPIIKGNLQRGGAKILPYRLALYTKIRDINLYIQKAKPENKFQKKYGFMALRGLNYVKNLFNKESIHMINPIKIRKFDNRIDEFFNVVKDNFDLINDKTKEKLNWRYCDPRGGEFTVFLAEEDESVLGFIVCRINKYDIEYPVGYIAEILTLPNRDDVVRSLLDKSLLFFNEYNVNQINYWALEGHPIIDIISRFGFLDSQSRTDIFFIVKKMPEVWEIVRKAIPSRIHFQLGDTDWI